MNARRLPSTLASVALALLGACGGPVPNPAITARPGAAPVSLGSDQGVAVECEGASAALGALCGYASTEAYWRGDSGAEFASAIGPEAGPYLVVLGFVPEDSTADQSAVIEYAVYLVTAPRAGSIPDQIGRWTEGESLDGEMLTQTARRSACTSGTWVAGGTLQAGAATIRFAINAGSPC